MMPISSNPHDLRLHRHGWICSILFHTIMGTSALALLSNMHLPIQEDTFTWNVALVEAPKPLPKTEVIQEPPPKPTPPIPKVTKTQPPPPQPIAQPVQQRVIQQVQAVQQVVERRAAEPVHTTVNQTASIVTQAVRETEVNEIEAPVMTREPVVQEEPLVATTMAVPRETATPVVSESVVSRQIVEPIQHQAIEAAVEPIAQPQQITQSAAAEPVVQTQPTATRQTVESVVERAVTEHAGVAAAQEQPAAVEQTVAHMAPAKSIPATRPDYGWLMRTLLSRVNQLKNYPHMARINHWEGKVVLRAVIKDDGQVLTIDVHESSGRSILDNDAMETLRKASPLKLEHPLGKPQVAILMPISYSLR